MWRETCGQRVWWAERRPLQATTRSQGGRDPPAKRTSGGRCFSAKICSRSTASCEKWWHRCDFFPICEENNRRVGSWRMPCILPPAILPSHLPSCSQPEDRSCGLMPWLQLSEHPCIYDGTPAPRHSRASAFPRLDIPAPRHSRASTLPRLGIPAPRHSVAFFFHSTSPPLRK